MALLCCDDAKQELKECCHQCLMVMVVEQKKESIQDATTFRFRKCFISSVNHSPSAIIAFWPNKYDDSTTRLKEIRKKESIRTAKFVSEWQTWVPTAFGSASDTCSNTVPGFEISRTTSQIFGARPTCQISVSDDGRALFLAGENPRPSVYLPQAKNCDDTE
eukprot:scaffold7353_cov87-Cylindrotheca_fusiformis.AAC.4